MALLDPTDEPRRSVGGHQRTNHPALCLAGGFAFIVAAALAVHVLFSFLP